MTPRQFQEMWLQLLWYAMAKTGKGCRRPSLKRDGRGERRKDKLVTTKLSRRLMQRSAGRFSYVKPELA